MKTITTLALLLCSMTLSSQGILKDKNGQLLRGTPLIIGKAYENNSVKAAQNRNTWINFRDNYKLNTVRLCWVDPWFKDNGQANWDVFRAIAEIDKAVVHAQATNMNVIINYHNTGEKIRKGKNLTKNQNIRVQFWRNIAKKYKNNDRVFFELSNEPVFDHRQYIEKPFKDALLQIYDTVRFEAPDRQIILFSFNNISDFMDDVVRNYGNRINWSRSSVGYHLYHGDWHETTSRRVRDLAKIRRVICTEFDNKNNLSYVKQVDGTQFNSQAIENIKHSWIDWRAWGDNSNNQIKQLVNDAKSKGYFWSGGGGSSVSTGVPIGKYIWLRKTGGDRRFLSIKSSTNVTANQTTVSWWEKFRVDAHPQGGVALRAQSNGKYLYVPNKDTNAAVKAAGNGMFTWERLQWKSKGSGKVAFRSYHSGKWLQVSHKENNGILRARGNGDWSYETFEYKVVAAGGKSLNTSSETLSAVLYPNPAQNEITITGLNDNDVVVIYNVSGTTTNVSSKATGGVATIDISSLGVGTYFAQNNQGGTIQFVKQ